MADETDTEETPDGVAGPLCGERLKAARVEQSIELDTIARELHVDLATLAALEENRFEALGAPVFAKGHLRKYAAFVKLPVDEILDDYRTLQSSTELPPVVVPKPAASRGFKPPSWLYGLLAAVFILVALLL
ncbi:MAG: helix-turn-helix domain-containing protein, partial [Pseudomonadota bacterium]